MAADKDDVKLPTFVASGLTRFPLTKDGSVNMEQILHTMNIVNSRLNDLQKQCVTKDMLKTTYKNVFDSAVATEHDEGVPKNDLFVIVNKNESSKRLEDAGPDSGKVVSLTNNAKRKV